MSPSASWCCSQIKGQEMTLTEVFQRQPASSGTLGSFFSLETPPHLPGLPLSLFLCLSFVFLAADWKCHTIITQPRKRVGAVPCLLFAPTIYQELPKRTWCQHTVNEMIRDPDRKVFIRSAIWPSPPNLRLLPSKNSSSWHLLKTDFNLAVSIATCCFSDKHASRSQVLLCTGCVYSLSKAPTQ